MIRMDKFFHLFQTYMKQPNKDSQYNLYNYTNHILETKYKSDISVNTEYKERIYTNMIAAFPEDAELYYKMGYLFVNTNREKALLWWRLAHHKAPENQIYFTEFAQLLFEAGYYDSLIALNKDNLFDKMKYFPPFLSIYVRLQLTKLQYKNGLQDLLQLIKIKAPKKCILQEEKLEKWRNYHDAGYVFSALCDHDNAIKYSEKATDLANKFELDKYKRLLSFENILSFSNHIYVDNDAYFKRCLEINNYLPDNPKFSFEKRKPSLGKKIKIAYLSSDFIYHSISNFLIPILKNHDTSQFEIVLFSNNSLVEKIYTDLKIPIYYIHDKSAIDAAKQIYKLNIDILIDLNGHTANNKLEVFIYHPAPIQVTYLGYPNTTGLKGMQYRITDSIADPLNSTQKYSETLLRVPRCFLLFDSIHHFLIKPKKTDPKKVVLASINKENKTNKNVLQLWKQILKECANTSILIKLESFDNIEERRTYYQKELDIDSSRLEILPKLQNHDYDQLFTKFDILLDPFPYSGTTTTCNSLLNSIPVVTLYHKDYHSHNVSASILMNAQLPEFIAYSNEQYLSIVKDLTENPEKLDKYKQNIRPKFIKSMEPKPFMTDYENQLTNIYNDFFYPKHCIESKPVIERIEINLNDDTNPIQSNKPSVYIGGCIKDFEPYIDDIFKNIDRIIPLFENYKIILAYDTIKESVLKILYEKQKQYSMELIFIEENIAITDYRLRSHRIANARNGILNYIRRQDLKCQFPYFIMMDMDNVSINPIDTNVLQYYLYDNTEWDALSFNRSDYYDIWALSIEPFLLSCWHFPNSNWLIPFIKNYITSRLSNLTENELLPCISAFNGFGLYKTSMFIDSHYDGSIKKTLDMFSKEQIEYCEKASQSKLTIDTTYHPIIHPTTDCEHRAFHLSAINEKGARIRISPRKLFI